MVNCESKILKAVLVLKITILTLGSSGDVIPFINLAHELAGRGHLITIASFPNFNELVKSEGFSFFPLSGDAEKFMNDVFQPGSAAVTYISRLEKSFRKIIPQLLKSMYESCAEADALVCNFFGTFYYSLAEKYNIPCIQTYFFPMEPSGSLPVPTVMHQNLPSWINRLSYSVAYLLIGLVERKYLFSWRKENGVDTRRPHIRPDYYISGRQIPAIYAISPSVFPKPADWNPKIVLSGFWFSKESSDYDPPEKLISFLEGNLPPVYIGFGSMNGGDMDELMRIAAGSVLKAGLRAVIYLGWSGSVNIPASDNIYISESYIPHEWLFPRVSAVVHHGGAGTTSAGLRFGRPTLIIPFSGDQYFWGTRVHELSCGPEPLNRKKLTSEKFTKSLIDLTSNPEYRVQSGKIGSLISGENGTKTAADIIEKEIACR